MSARAPGGAAEDDDMAAPRSSADPPILGPDDFGLPALPEPPGGVLELHDVWLLPGSCGLHDAAGVPIADTVLRRGPDLRRFPHGIPQAFDPQALPTGAGTDLLESAVWVAYASMGHFGHVLTEFAGNVGPLLAIRDGVDGIGGPGTTLLVPARAVGARTAVATFLGLPAERVLCSAGIERPLRIRTAYVPRPSMWNRYGLSRRHFDHVRMVLSRLHGVDDALEALARPDAGTKLYLTRSRLPDDKRRVRAEEDLERELTAGGWIVVAPESLPLRDQLAHLAAARTIAGSLGSALHLAMAFGAAFGRRRLVTLGLPAAQCNPNVTLQAVRQGMPLRHVVCHRHDPDSDTLLRFTLPPARVAAALEALATAPRW